MSAYAAAYGPPPGGYGSGFVGFRAHGGGQRIGKGNTFEVAGASPSAAPQAHTPPPAVRVPSSGTQPKFGTGGFSYTGLDGTSVGMGWPTPEQLVAAVPVRPFEFKEQARRVAVGVRAGIDELNGKVPKPYMPGEESNFSVLKGLLTDNEVAEVVAVGSKVLSDLIGAGHAREPDPCDGRPRFGVELARGSVHLKELEHVLQPLVDSTLLPYLREKFQCPLVSFASATFRRYVPEERRFLPPHISYTDFVTCVLSLQDASAYTGGMFVQGSGRAFLDRRFVPLGRGDVCVHGHDLQHGVEVQEGSRLEVVMLFKDSPQAAADGSAPWHQRAAELGDASAQYGMALSWAQRKEFAAAQAWLDRACAQGYPEALHLQAAWAWEPPAGSGAQPDTDRCLQLLRRAAEAGHARSQRWLGAMLAAGVRGRVQADAWEGKRLLRLAFEQDEPDAGFHLGQALLQEGDRDGATKLLAACLKGHPRACFQVAEMYREGQHHFARDVLAALRYTKWAAHQGDPQALSNLGHLLINGHGVVRDDAKAVRLFRHAAKLGAPEGMLNYGLALLPGNGGVKVDYQEALEWAKKAAAEGNGLAHQQLPMFFTAAKNPNPPARSLPSSRAELQRLGVKDLRDLLRSEGIDFSDCVEKSDLLSRAATHLLGAEEPWDPAPEHTLLLEPPRKTKAELLKLQQLRREHQRQNPEMLQPPHEQAASLELLAQPQPDPPTSPPHKAGRSTCHVVAAPVAGAPSVGLCGGSEDAAHAWPRLGREDEFECVD